MFLKWIKKNKLKILATGICTFAMALFTIISFNCKTYAMSIDNNGNLVGDNIFNINEPSSSTNVTYTINEDYQNIVISNGQTYGRIVYTYNLEPYTTYTIAFNYIQTLDIGYFVVGVNNSDINQPLQDLQGNKVVTFSTQSNGETSFRFYTNTSQNTSNELTLSYIMLNKGNEAQEWEPYGVWYSQQNYNTIEDMYNNILESTYPFKKNKINITSVIFNGQDITTEYKQDYDYTIDFQDTTITINSRDFEYLPNYNNNPDSYELLQMTCTYETPVQLTDVIAKSALSDLKESYCDVTFYLKTQVVTFLYLDNDMEDTDTQMLTGSTCTFDRIVFEIRISQEETQYNNYTTISSGGNFAQGYAQASTKYEEQMQNLSNEVSKRDSQILDLKKEITTTAQNQYNIGYQDGYNVGTSSNNTLYNMIIRS